MNEYRKTVVGLSLLALIPILWLVLGANAQIKSEPEAAAATTDQQYQRMLDEQDARFKRGDELLRAQEEAHKRALILFTKQEGHIKRQEEYLNRYQNILETWERQQRQYQKYLDSLGKK